jgi:hypothetical protein
MKQYSTVKKHFRSKKNGRTVVRKHHRRKTRVARSELLRHSLYVNLPFSQPYRDVKDTIKLLEKNPELIQSARQFSNIRQQNDRPITIIKHRDNTFDLKGAKSGSYDPERNSLMMTNLAYNKGPAWYKDKAKPFRGWTYNREGNFFTGMRPYATFLHEDTHRRQFNEGKIGVTTPYYSQEGKFNSKMYKADPAEAEARNLARMIPERKMAVPSAVVNKSFADFQKRMEP